MKLFVRISDNVLEPALWTTAELEFDSDGCVATCDVVNQGAYGLTDMVGWNMTQIAEWQDYDPTGRHPETYCEVSRDKRQWGYLLSKDEIQALAI